MLQYLQAWHVKISRNFITLTQLTPVIFQCSLHICRVFFYLWRTARTPIAQICSPSSTATSARHSAVPHHWHHCPRRPPSPPKDRTGDDLIVTGQACWVEVAALSIHNSWWPRNGARTCVRPSVAMVEHTSKHFSRVTNSKLSIQTCYRHRD